MEDHWFAEMGCMSLETVIRQRKECGTVVGGTKRTNKNHKAIGL